MSATMNEVGSARLFALGAGSGRGAFGACAATSVKGQTEEPEISRRGRLSQRILGPERRKPMRETRDLPSARFTLPGAHDFRHDRRGLSRMSRCLRAPARPWASVIGSR